MNSETINKDNKNNDFNVYYMNFPKVYEIAMMLNNQIVKSYQRENGKQNEDTYSLDAQLNANGNTGFLASIKTSLKSQHAKKIITNEKVIESIEVQTTKSILLRQIVKCCNIVEKMEDVKEGDLIKIDQIKMSLYDEESQRQFLLLKRGHV